VAAAGVPLVGASVPPSKQCAFVSHLFHDGVPKKRAQTYIMPLPALKPKTAKKYTFKAVEPESEEEPSVEEVSKEEAVDPLDGVEDIDEVQDIAQDIFDQAYKDNRRKYSKVESSFPPKTHVFIRLFNESTKAKEWVPLVYGKDNKASDMAMAEVMKALSAHDFKVSYRAETKQ